MDATPGNGTSSTAMGSGFPRLTHYHLGHDEHGDTIRASWRVGASSHWGVYRLVTFDVGFAFDHVSGDECSYLRGELLEYVAGRDRGAELVESALLAIPCPKCRTNVYVPADSDREDVDCYGCPTSYVTRLDIGGVSLRMDETIGDAA